jgi:hypothetical protein
VAKDVRSDRDDRHAQPEAMTWRQDNGVDDVRTERAIGDKTQERGYAETRQRAGYWNKEGCAVARVEASRLGLDIRFVVTNIDYGSAECLYDSLYCTRGQADNLIKLHRGAIPKARDLAKAEFSTLRLKLLKIAARVVEMASCVRLAFAAPSPETDLFAFLPAAIMPSGPCTARRESLDIAFPPARSKSAGLDAVKEPKGRLRQRLINHAQSPPRVANRS